MRHTEGCETSEGFIPHKKVVLDGHTFNAPVAVDVVQPGYQNAYRQVPRRTTSGKLLYALPGGKLTT